MGKHAVDMGMALLAAITAVCIVSCTATDTAGTKFLAKNVHAPGVVVLPSGVQYKIIAESEIPNAPFVWIPSKFECHYEGKRIDGTVFHTTDTNGKEIWGAQGVEGSAAVDAPR